jgi:hypothetical protein
MRDTKSSQYKPSYPDVLRGFLGTPELLPDENLKDFLQPFDSLEDYLKPQTDWVYLITYKATTLTWDSASVRCGSVKRRPDGPEIRLPLYSRKRTQTGHRGMTVMCQQATSSVALLLLRLIRGIDKNCLRRSLKLKLNDGFFVQRPYEMRLASGYDSECSDLSNFWIGGVKFFALAVVYLAAQNRSVFRIRVPVRRRLSVWWKLKT